MELHELILCETTAKDVIPALNINPSELIELKCYQAIHKIHHIISDDSLDDPECFWRIEKILCALEELGIGGGSRHDFG